jgi:chromate reductase
MIELLAISGSLRAVSGNAALLRAAATCAPAGARVALYGDLGRLPIFNPDDDERSPALVVALRESIARADGLLIASPEYAHGVTGAIKNALDWLVSGEEFVDKPVLLFNTGNGAVHAHAALRETLRTMSAQLHTPPAADFLLPRTPKTAMDFTADAATTARLREVLAGFIATLQPSPT